MRFVLAEAEVTSDRVKGVLDAAYAAIVKGWAVAPKDDPAGPGRRDFVCGPR